MAWQYLAVVQPSSFRAIDRAFQYSRMEKIAMKWMEERLKGATSLVKNLPSKVEGLLLEKMFRKCGKSKKTYNAKVVDDSSGFDMPQQATRVAA